MMRRILLAAVILKALVVMAAAQGPGDAPVAGANWGHVEALPVDTAVRVQARSRTMECRIKSVDADALTCVRGGKETVFQRGEVRSVRIPRRGRSTLVGTAIGGGTGAVIGFAVGTSSGNGFFGPNFLRGAVAGVFGVFGGVVGAPVGYFTDFTRSTVYKAP